MAWAVTTPLPSRWMPGFDQVSPRPPIHLRPRLQLHQTHSALQPLSRLAHCWAAFAATIYVNTRQQLKKSWQRLTWFVRISSRRSVQTPQPMNKTKEILRFQLELMDWLHMSFGQTWLWRIPEAGCTPGFLISPFVTLRAENKAWPCYHLQKVKHCLLSGHSYTWFILLHCLSWGFAQCQPKSTAAVPTCPENLPN